MADDAPDYCDHDDFPLHPCPYKQEVYGEDTLCTCCEVCTLECEALACCESFP